MRDIASAPRPRRPDKAPRSEDRIFGTIYTGPDLHETDPTYDGRLRRGARTRLCIAEAMIDLLEEGIMRPTAKQVAERAKVSVRLVFHHFDDFEAVFREAAMIQTGRHWKDLVVIPPTGSTDERIESTIQQRRRLYTAVTPVRQAASLRALEDESIRKYISDGRRRLRAGLATTFEPELDRAGANASVLLDAIESASSWETWNSLRSDFAKSAIAAQRIMRFSLDSLLH